MVLVPDPIECVRDEVDNFMAFGLSDASLQHAVNDVYTGNLALRDGEFSTSATRGWIRMDERGDDRVRGTLSWESVDEEGERVAWAEGAFDVEVCEWD